MVNKKINKSDKETIKTSIIKTLKSFVVMVPILLGVILLIGLFKTYITPDLISSIFKGKLFQDTLLGSLIGSISAGNPISSFIIGGELLKEGVSLFAVTAFIVSAEASILGKRFALTRNFLSFILAIVVAIATVLTLRIFT